MIDFHSHSTASDGRLSPTGLVQHALRRGLRALALTDHDTTAGVPEGRQEAKKNGLIFLSGVEIEIESETGEFHLLGLGLQEDSFALEKTLAELRLRRIERNLRIFKKMQEAGIRGDYSDVVALAGAEGVVGRPHLAQFLVGKGIVSSVQEAFDKYLARGQMFYEKKTGLELPLALELIKQAGGRSFVAHPLSLYLSIAKLEPLFVQWKAWGLDGIEAFHPGAPLRKCVQLEKLANALDLRISAGSDFHGQNRPDRTLGLTAGEREITDDFYEKVFGSPLPSADMFYDSIQNKKC